MRINYKYLFVFIVICTSCKSTKEIDKANQVFNEKIELIQNFVRLRMDTINGEKLYSDILFLEQLTGIKADVTQSFDPIYNPSFKNLKAWKEWYKANKHLMYWDDTEQKVKLKKE